MSTWAAEDSYPLRCLEMNQHCLSPILGPRHHGLPFREESSFKLLDYAHMV